MHGEGALDGYATVHMEDGSCVRGHWQRHTPQQRDTEGGREGGREGEREGGVGGGLACTVSSGHGVRVWADGSRYAGHLVGVLADGHGTLHGLHYMRYIPTLFFLSLSLSLLSLSLSLSPSSFIVDMRDENFSC
jgi:hypothetical protein